MKELKEYISKNFDTRMEDAVFSYILEKGFDSLKKISDDDINQLEGSGLMTTAFVQALVRSAVYICKSYTPIDIMRYIRLECNFMPYPDILMMYKEWYTNTGWEKICAALDIDPSEKKIEVLAIRIPNEEEG